MLILPDYGHPFPIDDVNGPIAPKHSWFYDVEVNDFLLRPIRFLEETVGPVVKTMINGFRFDVPASWNLLVVDEETKLIDTLQISQCGSSNLKALLVRPDQNDYVLSPVVLIDLVMQEVCVHTMIPRMHMMLCPAGTYQNDRRRTNLSYSCLLSPQDLGKHMVGMTVMEVLL